MFQEGGKRAGYSKEKETIFLWYFLYLEKQVRINEIRKQAKWKM